MSHRLPAALLLAATLSVAAAIRAQEAQDPAPAALPDLSALLECRLGYADFMAYMPVLQDPLKAVALGWRPQPQANPFMLDYRLNTPVTVFGRPAATTRMSACPATFELMPLVRAAAMDTALSKASGPSSTPPAI